MRYLRGDLDNLRVAILAIEPDAVIMISFDYGWEMKVRLGNREIVAARPETSYQHGILLNANQIADQLKAQ
jgi:hypothetical protein